MQQLILLRFVLGGWLRAAETFSLDDEDVEIVIPANGGLQLMEDSTVYLFEWGPSFFLGA
jgi:hypothetical protein